MTKHNKLLPFHKAISTVLGVGYSSFAPGTMGTLAGIIIYYLMFYYGGCNTWCLIGSTALITLLSYYSVTAVERVWEHDAGKIVIDELIGVWITLFFIPFSVTNIILAFILFRVFDILKPFGIKHLDEKMNTPFSVILDDMLAGVYANICMLVLVYYLIPFFNS